ncbi:hypothetical protein A6R68_13803 [Neotoma lepida]|uniref:Uncharacterized protein n=1 Tax=Neotoma lepida TaxID=56216 RepID=A0A1A6H044_NEOLE|nr:hypothetical protein A6R68_13803 [Neotoma lepida]
MHDMIRNDESGRKAIGILLRSSMQYIYKRENDGVYIINLKRTWEKLLLVARAIVPIEDPADVSVIPPGTLGSKLC